jgi:hypothetical protein
LRRLRRDADAPRTLVGHLHEGVCFVTYTLTNSDLTVELFIQSCTGLNRRPQVVQQRESHPRREGGKSPRPPSPSLAAPPTLHAASTTTVNRCPVVLVVVAVHQPIRDLPVSEVITLITLPVKNQRNHLHRRQVQQLCCCFPPYLHTLASLENEPHVVVSRVKARFAD